jgi:hypothetical protein
MVNHLLRSITIVPFATDELEKRMQLPRRLLLALVILPLLDAAAAAAAPPPLGRWASAGGNVLVVNDDATCAYQTPTLKVQGTCSWQAGQSDGILYIEYQSTPQSPPQRMDVHVRWIDRANIVVLGESFRRR